MFKFSLLLPLSHCVSYVGHTIEFKKWQVTSPSLLYSAGLVV
jgi:hypothetical protein